MRDLPQLEKKPGTALVLSGGGTKAFYFHLGVLKTLESDMKDVTSIVGSSAGALLGAFLASGMTVDNLLVALHQKRAYLPRFDKWVNTLTSGMLFRPEYLNIARLGATMGYEGARFMLSLPWLINRDLVAEAMDRLLATQRGAVGFFDAVALEELFTELLPSTSFSETAIDLYVTATGLDDGMRAVFNGRYNFRDDDNIFMDDVPINKAVRASAAVPALFEPVKINGDYYIDGEIKQTLSVDVGMAVANRVIVSHTYRPLYANGQHSVRDLGWLNIIKQTINIVLAERIEVWRGVYEREHPNIEILWIEPDPDDVEFFLASEFSFRPEVQRQLIKCGERAAQKALEQARLIKY